MVPLDESLAVHPNTLPVTIAGHRIRDVPDLFRTPLGNTSRLL